MDKYKMKNIRSLNGFQNVSKENVFKIKNREASETTMKSNHFKNFNDFNGIH